MVTICFLQRMKGEFRLRYCWLFVMIFFACDLAQAQLDLQFSGYVVDLPIYQSLNSTFAQLLDLKQHQALNLTRIRLRPSLSLWDGATLSLEHEVTALYQSASFQSLQVGSETNTYPRLPILFNLGGQAFCFPSQERNALRWVDCTPNHPIIPSFVRRGKRGG